MQCHVIHRDGDEDVDEVGVEVDCVRLQLLHPEVILADANLVMYFAKSFDVRVNLYYGLLWALNVLQVIYCLLCPVNCNPSHQTVKLYGTCITWYSFCLLSSIMNFLPPRTMTRVPPNILSNTTRLCIVLIQSAAGYWRKCDDSLPCSTLIRGPEVALRPVDTSCSILTRSRCEVHDVFAEQ